MKISLIFFLLFFVCSCGGKNSNEAVAKPVTKDWIVTDSTASSHIYSKEGLLDSTYSTTYIFVLGLISDSIKSLATKEYNSKNLLIHEKTFDIAGNKPLQLNAETINLYDDRNNLISNTIYVRGELYHFSGIYFNKNNQRIKQVSIDVDYKKDPGLVANKPGMLDTTLLVYQYDEAGNCVKTIRSNKKNTDQHISYMLYDGSKRKLSYSLNETGDTTSVTVYTTEDGFTKLISRGEKLSGIDTSWSKNDRPYKSISYNEMLHVHWKHIFSYNLKGDQISSASYKK